MKCANCKEDILQKHPAQCPYCGSTDLISDEEDTQNRIAEIKHLEKAGRYEEAAIEYEKIEMLDKAEECRRRAKTSSADSAEANIGRVSAISMECPHRGSSQPISQKTSKVTCNFCGKYYVIPKKVLDLL